MFDGTKVQKILEICKKNDKYFINDKYDLINDNNDNKDNFFWQHCCLWRQVCRP